MVSSVKPKRIALSWSSGKDSAHALHLLRKTPEIEIAGLVTTFNEAVNRVAMHAVRRSLVERQAELAGLPLWSVGLPWPCTNERYEALMGEQCGKLIAQGIDAIAFGDLFLRDIRDYRERLLAGTGLAPLFPLWDIPTYALAREMMASGLKARITCVDPSKIDRAFAGRDFDESLLPDLPPAADPCGENGEFHTFAWDSPAFRGRIEIQSGEIVERDGFVFADVMERAG